MRRSSSRIAALRVLALCMALSACVTINVYFPAAAAEKAADRIIDDIWGSQPAPSLPEQSSSLQSQPSPVLLAAASVLDLLVAPAQAQSADLNVSTPAIRQLTAAMEARHGQLKKYYDAGAVGLTNDGLVALRDQNAVPLAERTAVRKLVSDENADRNNLYREIASANGQPQWEADIRSTFAQRWVTRAAAGWYIQDGSGNWRQK